MKVGIVFGLGQRADGDGNGLRGYGEAIKVIRPSWDITYQAWNETFIQPADIHIAHSYGCAAIIRRLRDTTLKPYTVRYFGMIDAVPNWDFNQHQDSEWMLPSTVTEADCFYRGAFLPPWSSPIRTPNANWRNTKTPWATHNGVIARAKQTILTKVGTL